MSESLGRRRNSWDYVRETQRRQRAAAEEDWQKRADTTPDRPLNVWRVCGAPVTDGPGSGCTCTTAPNRWTAQRALNRLDSEKGGPVNVAPRARETTRKPGG
jgi:hypothetical protein